MRPMRVSDTWESGNPYEQYVGRWSRRVAPLFLSWLSIPAGRRWLDVGCGTGALSASILDQCSPASVVGVEPSEGFLSGLVLNFVPDQRAALVETARVTVRGGTIGAYVWDYAGKMEMMRAFWDAAVELDPAAASVDEG